MTERVGEDTYKCGVCGFMYKEEQQSIDCEEWCKTHSSCNIKITELAIGIDEEDHKL